MSEDTMPAAEANEDVLENETYAYELAFHVLPTVAEGEVSSVFEQIKSLITKDGGSIFDEEAPERFELAYEIVKHLEGKNRKFTSAYFGWVRFKAESSIVESLLEEIEGRSDILRHLLIKLSRVEEENPFRFHPALAHEKKVTTIDEAELVVEAKEAPEVVAVETEGAVDMEEVEKALKNEA
jgi:ribosomal protein S6